MAKLSRKNKVLICVFSIYWFIVFPIIWFVIRPSSIVHHLGQALLFALSLLIVYLMLHAIVVCLFKKFKMEESAEPRDTLEHKNCSGDGNPNWSTTEEHFIVKTPPPDYPEATMVTIPLTTDTTLADERNSRPERGARKLRPLSSFKNPYDGTPTSRLLRAMQANTKYERNITRKFITEEQNHTNNMMPMVEMDGGCCEDKSGKYVTSIKLFYDGNKKFQVDG